MRPDIDYVHTWFQVLLQDSVVLLLIIRREVPHPTGREADLKAINPSRNTFSKSYRIE